MNKNIVAIIQARLGSSRLPEKMLKVLSGKPMIYHVSNCLQKSSLISEIVIATTMLPQDDPLNDWSSQHGIKCFRGSEKNVLSRFYFAATEVKADVIVRITGDDPFKDFSIIDEVIRLLITEDIDFACNNYPPSFPEGMDVEVFTYSSLKKAFENSTDEFEKEHVTQYFYRNPKMFKIKNYSYKKDVSFLRLTVDTQMDFILAEEVYKRLYFENKPISFDDILALYNSDPDLFTLNQNEVRSHLYKKKKIE